MVDFGRRASDYARHRQGFPSELFDRLAARGLLAPGRPAVDLGTGTGAVARELAARGLDVTAVDISLPLLEHAATLAADQGVTLRLVEGRAEATGLPEASAALVTAGQCWHWFDRPRAAAECRRLLAGGGHLAIAHLDWLPYGDNPVAITERVISAVGARYADNLSLGQEGLYPPWTRDVREAGFVDVETFSFDVDLTYSHDGWRGRVRACGAIGGTLDADAVDRFDARLAAALAPFPDPLAVPHRVWAVIARRPNG